VVDIIDELKDYNIDVDVHDPWCSIEEAKTEYDIVLTKKPAMNSYDGIILAVGHNEFKALGSKTIRKFGKSEHVLYDLKYVLDKHEIDIRL
jgi:UDP-N-acetyl-D-galactosamine dehydrogenase